MDFKSIWPYVTGGNSTFTVYSVPWDTRYTYKVTVDSKNYTRFFVKVLFGQDNENDYRFLGWFYKDIPVLRSSNKCFVNETDRRFVMFKAFLQLLYEGNGLPPDCQFYPSGRCGRCGRKLTTPESIERGIGPECWLRNI